MPLLDNGPTIPVTVTPEDMHHVARQFADAADGLAELRENLWNGLRSAAGWAGIDEQARRFGQQFTDAYQQLETGSSAPAASSTTSARHRHRCPQPLASL